jgi:hypothetical protein
VWVRRLEATVRIGVHQVCELGVEGRRHRSISGGEKLPGVRPKPPGRLAGGLLRRPGDQICTHQEIDRHVLVGLHLLAQPVGPGREEVEPPPDAVPVGSNLSDHEGTPPPVVAQRLHADLVPGSVLVPPEPKRRRDRVMPVGEDVGLDHDPFSDRALRGEPPAVDLGDQVFDHDASSTFFHLHGSHLLGEAGFRSATPR